MPMNRTSESGDLTRQRREQMLRLVAKGFYKELINYGVEQKEVLQVASHLLDNLMDGGQAAEDRPTNHDTSLKLSGVSDGWREGQVITVDDVQLRPLGLEQVPLVLRWLEDPAIRGCFVTPLPETVDGLAAYFSDRHQDYLQIVYGGESVGFIGGENIDTSCGRLEMKKCVGRSDLRGRGIGKKATFGFLYYAFILLGLHKVYIYSRDINMRNINLNSRLGFEVEGIFLEELVVDERRQDVVRMALLKPVWEQLFATEE